MNKDNREFSLAWWLIFVMILSVAIVPILWAPLYSRNNQYALSSLGELVVVLIPILVGVCFVARKKELNRLGFKGFPLKILPILLILPICAQPFLNLITWPVVLVSRLLFDVENVTEVMPIGGREWSFAIFSVAILAPVVEEVVFRGILMNLFEKYGTITALLMTSLAFSMMHLSPETAVLMFFMGLLLGVIRLSTGSLWAAIVAHSANNIAAFLPSVIPSLYDKITMPVLFLEVVLFPLMLCLFFKLLSKGQIKKINCSADKKAGFSWGKLLSISLYAGYAGVIMAIKLIKTMTYYM